MKRQTWLIQVTIVAGFVLLWTLVSVSGIWFERLFPTPWVVLIEAIKHLQQGIIYPHFFYSAYEVLWGFLIGAGLGLALGLVLGSRRALGEIFEPLVLALAPVPKIIIYPVFLWFLGIGIYSRVAMGAASTFFPMVIYAAVSVRQVSPIHLEAARLLGASPWSLWTKIYMPAMLPYLWVGLRLGIAISIVGILLAETKMSQKGLGFLIIEYYTNFQITEMYAVLLLVFALAIAINSFLSWVQGRIPALRHGRQVRGGMF